MSAETAAWPIAWTGWRTVVSGGSVKPISGESSKPTTDTSSGTRRPRDRAARITPRAMRSDPQMMAVWPESMSSCAAVAPPSTVNRVVLTCGAASSTPSCARSWSANACRLRAAGTNRSGPIARPMRRWPSATRCRTDSSIATESSVAMLGASTASARPLTSTIGSPRPRSAW